MGTVAGIHPLLVLEGGIYLIEIGVKGVLGLDDHVSLLVSSLTLERLCCLLGLPVRDYLVDIGLLRELPPNFAAHFRG